MSENTQNRPQKSNWFLYTLCSFSLLTSFIYLIFTIIQLSSIEFLSKKIAYATDLVDRIDEENIQQLSLIVNDVKDYLLIQYQTSIISSLLVILAALLMIYLRKSGFWIYIVGKSLPVIFFTGLFTPTNEYVHLVSSFHWIFSFFYLSFALIFILLYGFQYKKLIRY
jgi:hypothetical protein